MLLTLVGLACDGEPTTSDQASGGATGGAAMGGAGGSATGGSGGGPSAECPAAPAGAPVVQQVVGRFVGPDGAPVEDVGGTLCGSICYALAPAAAGRFELSLGCPLPLADYSVVPHARPAWAGFYFQLPASPGPDGVLDLGALPLIRLPEAGPLVETALTTDEAPAQTLTSGDVTLLVDAGTKVWLDFEDVAAGDAGRRFEAVPIPAERWATYAPDVDGLLALYALQPFDVRFTDAGGDPAEARIRFESSYGLAAGSEVEVVALGSFLFADWVPPARFATVASGRVTPDGEGIELEPGEGIRHLTWVGVRQPGDTP